MKIPLRADNRFCQFWV